MSSSVHWCLHSAEVLVLRRPPGMLESEVDESVQTTSLSTTGTYLTTRSQDVPHESTLQSDDM